MVISGGVGKMSDIKNCEGDINCEYVYVKSVYGVLFVFKLVLLSHHFYHLLSRYHSVYNSSSSKMS